MGTLRSLAATGDRARGFLKHRDTETQRAQRGKNEGGKNEGGKNDGGKNDGGKNDGGKRGLGIKRWERRVGGKKSGGSR